MALEGKNSSIWPFLTNPWLITQLQTFIDIQKNSENLTYIDETILYKMNSPNLLQSLFSTSIYNLKNYHNKKLIIIMQLTLHT